MIGKLVNKFPTAEKPKLQVSVSEYPTDLRMVDLMILI